MMNGRRKLGQPHSSNEAREQNRCAGGGAGGAKGVGQGESAAAKHEPGPGPGSRAKCALADTASSGER